MAGYCFLVGLALTLMPTWAAADQPSAVGFRPLPALGHGITVRLGQDHGVPSSQEPENPLFARLVVPWEQVEGAAGGWDFDELERAVELYRDAGYRVILCLTGDVPPLADDEERLAAWLGFVRHLAESYRGRVDLFQVWDRPNTEAGWGGAPSARDYSFLLKSTAVTLRSVIPWAWVSQGALEGADAAFQESLFQFEVAPYIDAVALAGAPSQVREADLQALQAVVREHDAASPLWFAAVPASSSEALGRELIAAMQRGGALTLFDLDGEDALQTLLALRRHWSPAVSRMAVTPGQVGNVFRGTDGGALEVSSATLFDGDAFRVLLLYMPAQGTPSGTAEVVLNTSDVSRPLLVDLQADRQEEPDLYIPNRETDTTSMDLPLGPGPRLLVYQRFVSDGTRRAPEALEVEDVASITAEEIMALHQAFQSAQDDKLQSYLADAQVDLHFSIGTGGSLDVRYLNGFFFQRNAGTEWERRELFVNGTRWRAEKMPELPLIQPDKVLILPLDLHLDRTYRYRLDGTDVVDGYRTWRLTFEPVQPDDSLYRGKVWIDQRTYARVQMAVRQKGKAPPFLSNDEVDRYRPVLGPDGSEHWVLQSLTSSQLYTVSGRNFAVNREVVFSGFRINPEDFAARQEQAYRSHHSILRDTDQGLRYLARTPDGGREVQQEVPRNQAFWLGGVFFNAAVDNPIPFAGINYYDFDFHKTGTQVNIFFAGALLTGSLTDPDLFGSRLEGGFEVFGIAFASTDRVFLNGKERERFNVDRKTQSLRSFLALPFQKFWKVQLSYRLAFDNFHRDEEAAGSFRTPQDTLIQQAGLGLEFNRRAWSARLNGRFAKRERWEPWGTPDERARFDPESEDYFTWEARLAKEIYLPKFQKLRFAASYMDGDDLDRFSQFQFDSFSNRLRGFGGSGLRFDRGGIVRAQYSFNVMEVVRFDFNLDHARVRDPFAQLDEDRVPVARYLEHTGAGISGNFIGPWGTILTFDLGVAVASDVEDVEGEFELQFVVLKLLSKPLRHLFRRK